MLGRSNCRCSRAVEHHLDFGDILFHQLQRVEQRRAGDDCGAMLIIVEDGNVHRFLQSLFDVEAFRRLDILEVDTAKCRLE